MNIIKFLPVLFCLTFLPRMANSQNTTHIDVVHKSPEQGIIEQYGRMSVNNSTGVPNIDIPLHVVKIDGIEIPISVSYLSTGIRVNDISSSVGMNWMLNAGGAISRTIVGKADESSGGWLDNYKTNTLPYVLTCDLNKLKEFYELGVDAAPDIFSYYIGSFQGGFFYDENESIVKINGEGLKISEYGFFPSSITDDLGNIYYFDEHGSGKESTYIISGSNNISYPTNHGSGVTAVKVERVISPSGGKVEFSYEPYSFSTGFFQLLTNFYLIQME